MGLTILLHFLRSVHVSNQARGGCLWGTPRNSQASTRGNPAQRPGQTPATGTLDLSIASGKSSSLLPPPPLPPLSPAVPLSKVCSIFISPGHGSRTDIQIVSRCRFSKNCISRLELADSTGKIFTALAVGQEAICCHRGEGEGSMSAIIGSAGAHVREKEESLERGKFR